MKCQGAQVARIVNQMEVKKRVLVQEDLEECVVTGVVVGEAELEEEEEGGAEVEDVVVPVDRGDVVAQVLRKPLTSSGAIRVMFQWTLFRRELVPTSLSPHE